MNAGIARTTEKVAALKRENSRLRLEAARLGSSERIQRAAADLGLVLPAPGEVRYLDARPERGPGARAEADERARSGAGCTRRRAGAARRRSPRRRRRPRPRRRRRDRADHPTRAGDRWRRSPLTATDGHDDAARDDRADGLLGRAARRAPHRLPLRTLPRPPVFAAARATWLGTVESRDLGARALGQQVEEITVYARRGTITDRNGIELAVSEDATTVFANPFLIDDPAGAAREIAPLLGMPEEEVMEKLADSDTGFVYLRRKLDSTRGEKINQLGIEGIGTVVEPRRTYPQGSLASQVLGSVGTDNYGLSGLEQSHEETLHGTDGRARSSRTPPASRSASSTSSAPSRATTCA